ncbi:hypothetical protein TRVL_01252 [Trypanosoma vivax]|nr:hypothetical protein TRVL_01252 [Trypanosoma vivax]
MERNLLDGVRLNVMIPCGLVALSPFPAMHLTWRSFQLTFYLSSTQMFSRITCSQTSSLVVCECVWHVFYTRTPTFVGKPLCNSTEAVSRFISPFTVCATPPNF